MFNVQTRDLSIPGAILAPEWVDSSGRVLRRAVVCKTIPISDGRTALLPAEAMDFLSLSDHESA